MAKHYLTVIQFPLETQPLAIQEKGEASLKAICIYEHGGPEVLRFEEMPRPIPRATEVLVRNEAIGVNFVDTEHRAGLNYPVTLPLIQRIASWKAVR